MMLPHYYAAESNALVWSIERPVRMRRTRNGTSPLFNYSLYCSVAYQSNIAFDDA